MKNDYTVIRHQIETTDAEKEEIYKELANLFIRMAQKEFEKKKN